jgi:alanine racemase
VSVARAVARIDAAAVSRNCERLRALLGGRAELCAVVKADGYGHGDVRCAEAALRGGASWLAVAAAGEARTLREAGVDAPLLVMGALTDRELELALASRADVVAWTERFARRAAELAADGKLARVHVKLDTGMGRLGTKDPDEASALARLVADEEHLELTGVMTHFATADEPGDDYFPAQLGAFRAWVEEIRRDHPAVIAHAANSAAVIRDPSAHFDMARCGIAVYGLDPFNEDPDRHGLEPALSLESYVAAVKRFEPGESAGYGRTWRAEGPTWLGVLPIGYGDGWRRALSNNADVLVRGRRRAMVGTVSMDNVTIDLGGDTDVEVGDRAILIGRQGDERILCEEVAGRLGTINYEVACGLASRVQRVPA